MAKAAGEQSPTTVKIENGANDATIYLYGVIDEYWGVSAQAVATALTSLPQGIETLHVRINSPGGDVFEARAIKTLIEQHSAAKKIAHVDGIAASAASFVMMAADEIEASKGAMIMVHNAWSVCWGNKHDMRTTADLLDKIDETLIADYAKKTGKAKSVVTGWIDAETWFEAQEALDAGLIDRVFEKDAVDNRFDLSAYKNVPKALAERTKTTEADDEKLAGLRAAYHARLRLIETTLN